MPLDALPHPWQPETRVITYVSEVQEESVRCMARMGDASLAWLETAAREQRTLVARDLLLYETGNVLWGFVRTQVHSVDEAKSVLTRISAAPTCRIDSAVVAADGERLVRALKSTPFKGRPVSPKP